MLYETIVIAVVVVIGIIAAVYIANKIISRKT
jgi:uncharacterized protein YneF (UPF0154 family)